MDYKKIVKEKGMKSGVHLFQGDNHLKSISLTDLYGSNWLTGTSDIISDIETLFKETAWLYAAIQKRKSYMRQIPVNFYKDKEVVTGTFSNITLDILARIDMTIQLYGVCYFQKEYNLGGQVSLEYLNPAYMTGDITTVYRGGYRSYQYGNAKGGLQRIPETDLLIIQELGTSEYKPQVSATQASSINSTTIRGMNTTLMNFYETNGLPVVAVIVPDATLEESQAIKTRFDRVFGKLRGDSNKVIGLSGDIKIEVISFAPKDLDINNLSEQQINAILATQEVSPALIYRSVNRAEAEMKIMELLMTLDSRAKMITSVINTDPDFIKANRGITLVTDITKHSLFQKSNLEIATSIQLLTGTPILTINEGRGMLELSPIEGGDTLFTVQPTINETNVKIDQRESTPTKKAVKTVEGVIEPKAVESPKIIEEPVVEIKSEAWKQEASVFNRWLKRRENPDISAFKSEFLTDTDKKELINAMLKMSHEEETEIFLFDERDTLEEEHAVSILAALETQLSQLEDSPENELATEELLAAILALLLAANALGVESFNRQVETHVDVDEALDNAIESSNEQALIALEQINTSTADKIKDAIEAGLVGAALSEALKPLFNKTRAELIAQDQGTHGFTIGLDSSGEVSVTVSGFEWSVVNDDALCPICRPMEGITRLKGEPFIDPSGREIFIPAHVKCRCSQNVIELEV